VSYEFTYHTLASSSESFLKEKGSKFYGYAFEVASEEAIKSALEEIKQLHPKARHICYAYRLGIENVLERANDAGEPSGSAGLPILNQIKSAGITNCLLVVVRYFGGTKLGIPGLIQAYKSTAAMAIEQNSIVEKARMQLYTLQTSFEHSNVVFQLLKPFDGMIKQQLFNDNEVIFEIEIPLKVKAAFELKIKDQFQITLTIRE
jgi:uncharacterized YigZ family protein